MQHKLSRKERRILKHAKENYTLIEELYSENGKFFYECRVDTIICKKHEVLKEAKQKLKNAAPAIRLIAIQLSFPKSKKIGIVFRKNDTYDMKNRVKRKSLINEDLISTFNMAA